MASKNFVANAQWSFDEALDEAWKLYRGSGKMSIGVRGRCLRQWANLVGPERAVRELDAATARLLLEKEFSRTTIARMRKDFGAMPPARPAVAAAASSFAETFRRLAKQDYDGEIDLLAKALVPLARSLGWSDQDIFFRVHLPGAAPIWADAVLAASRTAPASVIIEVKRVRYQPGQGIADHIRSMMNAAGAPVGLYLSPHDLVLLDKAGEYVLTSASPPETFDRFKRALDKRLASRPTKESPAPIAGAGIESLLNDVDSAVSNDQKKVSLETLARALLNGLPSWRCKYANLRTKTAEIDIVVEQAQGGATVLAEFGRYVFVECKNWKKPIDAKHVRDFIAKMMSAGVRLGIVFSTSGITGADQGTDALRVIERAYSEERTAVVVLSREDFAACADPQRFLALVDDRVDQLRFDL